MIKSLRPSLPRVDQRTASPAPKRALPFYLSPEWRGLVADLVQQRGSRCQDPECKHPGRLVRVVGDHVRELADGGAPLDPRNVLLRCWPCHARKTAKARAARLALPAAAAAPGRGVVSPGA